MMLVRLLNASDACMNLEKSENFKDIFILYLFIAHFFMGQVSPTLKEQAQSKGIRLKGPKWTATPGYKLN